MADAAPFGTLLREHRVSRSLTQERLAERAGVSTTAIAALEAGRRRAPRLSTVALLVDALGLDGAQRVALAAAAVSGRLPDGAGTETASAARRPASPTEYPGVIRQIDFVGRPEERAALDAAWQRRTRVVLVSGEAGAGKTRLVGELALVVAAEHPVLWGRCTPERLGVYEPFVDPVRVAMREPRLEPATNPILRELERMLPELAAGRSGTPGPSIAAPDVERRLLFDAVAALLAATGRALLVVDDLHWADAGSLALLSHLAASPALGDLTIVGMIRSTDLEPATAAALAELRRVATVTRLTLTGLTGADLGALVRAVAGSEVPDAFIATIAAATEGNPLFAAELTEHLLAHGWDAPAADDPVAPPPIPVPAGLRDTLTQRLHSVSPAGQALVRAGAVLGRTFAVDLAAQLADLDVATVVVATEDALLSGLVFEASARALTFSHALVHSAVYESLSARRRLDTHRRAAIAASAVDIGTIDAAAVCDIARHWACVAADDPAALDDAVRWAIRAGDAAAASADIGEAVRRYEWAEQRGSAPTAARVDGLLKLGGALSALSDTEAADARFRAALALASSLGDVRRAADAAIGLAATVRFGHHDPARIDALERALRDLPLDDPVRRPTAASMLKRQLGFDPSDAAYRRRQVAARIVLDAVSVDPVPNELLVSLGAARDAIVVDDPVVLERVSRQMVAVARPARNLPMLANAWYGTAWAALELADGARWREATTEFAAVAAELALPYELALAARMDAATALMEGRYDDAERFGQRSLELAATADPNAGAIQLTNAVMRGIDRGDARATVDVMLAVRAELNAVPTFNAGLALTAACAGEVEVAHEILDAHAEVGYENVRRDLEWLPVIGLLCHTCLVIGAADHTATLFDVLASHPARAVRIGPLGAWWGPTDYFLGGLARLMGDGDGAETRLRGAVDTCVAMGARPWAARARLALAGLLDARGERAAEVESLRGEARRTATELGAPGLLVPLP